MTIPHFAICLGLVLLVTGCGGGPTRYSSQDLALLPCETGASPVFFQPLEFAEDGTPAVGPEQMDRILTRLSPETSDVLVFVHGWSKNPDLAERDFSDFICRLHGHVREVARERNLWLESEKGQRFMVIGIFWPSTMLADARDALPLKPCPRERQAAIVDALRHFGIL